MEKDKCASCIWKSMDRGDDTGWCYMFEHRMPGCRKYSPACAPKQRERRK